MGNIKPGPWPGHRNLDEVQACETPVQATTYAHGLYTQYFWMKYKLYEINSSWGQ